MKIDSILKTPLPGGLTVERVICANGDVTIDIHSSDGAAVFSEEIVRIAKPVLDLSEEPEEPEQL